MTSFLGLCKSTAQDAGSFHDLTVANPAMTLLRKGWQLSPTGAVVSRFWSYIASRDPAPPARLPSWGFGGDGARSSHPGWRILCRNLRGNAPVRLLRRGPRLARRHYGERKHPPTRLDGDRQERFKAIVRGRDAPIAGGCDHRRRDEGNRLATTFGARFLRGRSSKETRSQAQF